MSIEELFEARNSFHVKHFQNALNSLVNLKSFPSHFCLVFFIQPNLLSVIYISTAAI
jgi:hypothetical protein